MRKLLLLFVMCFSVLGVMASAAAAESASPYDSVVDTSKSTTSAVDAVLDSAKEVNKSTAGKLAEYLKNSSIWKSLSEKAQGTISKYLGKLGPLVKKLGWIINAIDLAPSIYKTVTALNQRDKEGFKKAFRDTTLKTVSILTGIAIGAAVSAATPVVVAAIAATGGAAVVVAAAGAVVAIGAGMVADEVVKKLFSKKIEDFADKLYDDLVDGDIMTTILQTGGGSSGGGSGGKGGAVK